VAHADPSYYKTASPVVCTGSDTLQDLFNAFSGEEPSPGPQPTGPTFQTPTFYPVFHSSLAGTNGHSGSPYVNLQSFDATDPHVAAPSENANTQTIQTKTNGSQFDRPNGSGDGRVSLYDSKVSTGTLFQRAQSPGTAANVKGQVDCARSSSASGTAGNTPTTGLSLIPFAADGIGYAYHCASALGSADCNALAALPRSVFGSLYNINSSTTLTANGILTSTQGGWTGTNTLKACAINVGSGTFKTFLGQTSGGISTQTAENNLTAGGASGCFGIEENNLSSFLSNTATLDAAADWVIPTSFGNDIGQHNGAALNRSYTFFNNVGAGGGFIGNNGLAGVADAWNANLQAAISSGATSIQIKLKPAVAASLTLTDQNTHLTEAVTVTSVGAPVSGVYTVGITATTNAYTISPLPTVVTLTNGINLGANFPTNGSNWTPNATYDGSQLGRWVFVAVASSDITALTVNQSVADMFYTPLAKNDAGNPATALVCQGAAQTLATTFGFDTSLPDNGISGEQGGSCGNVAFSGATS
jgi:hypothetical protein